MCERDSNQSAETSRNPFKWGATEGTGDDWYGKQKVGKEI